MTDNARETGASLEAMYRFVLWLVPTLEGCPRSQRFLLGDWMQTAAMVVLDLLVRATSTRDARSRLCRHPA